MGKTSPVRFRFQFLLVSYNGERNEVVIPDIPPTPPPTKFYLWTSWLEVTSSSTSFQRKANIIPSRCWAKLLYNMIRSDSGIRGHPRRKKTWIFEVDFFVWPQKNPSTFCLKLSFWQLLRGWTFVFARVTWGDPMKSTQNIASISNRFWVPQHLPQQHPATPNSISMSIAFSDLFLCFLGAGRKNLCQPAVGRKNSSFQQVFTGLLEWAFTSIHGIFLHLESGLWTYSPFYVG